MTFHADFGVHALSYVFCRMVSNRNECIYSIMAMRISIRRAVILTAIAIALFSCAMLSLRHIDDSSGPALNELNGDDGMGCAR